MILEHKLRNREFYGSHQGSKKSQASPFTDLTMQGPDGIFSSEQVDELIDVLKKIRATAIAA
jgi:hypothetical protein